MNLSLNDDQRLLAESLRRFLQQENQFEHRRARLRAEPPQRMALWPGLADLGLIGAAFDEAHGGFAGDARTLAMIMAELGRSLAVEPFLGCAVIAGRVLLHVTDADAATLIGELIAGERVCVLAHDAGHDPFGAPLPSAEQSGGELRLSGTVRGVRHADVAHEFLLSARLGGETVLLRLPRDSAGLRVETYRLMDAAGAADLQLDGVRLPPAARLRLAQPSADVIRDALEWGLLGLVAETAGIVEAANAATFGYLQTRKQFGAPLASFQALQHRAADMHIAAEEIGAALNLLVRAFEDPASTGRSALLAAAKAVADSAGRRAGHDAIQLHGGMGVSDELDISHYGRRLATIRAELGSADLQRARFAQSAPAELGTLLALQETPDERRWRAEVAGFVQQQLPADIARKGELGLKIDKDDYVRWQKILYREDWFAGAWAREHGGQGWDLRKQLIFTQEAAVANAPMIIPYGVNMVGPVICSFGSEAQRHQHLPGILASDVWWCQGYSEPGAGSDLAAIKTFAERDGDHYIVNGAKMWTTEAHWADWMHCLVRTDRSGKPQTGISFLLIDMKTPGIEIKPVVTIDGIHHTNALFLDNLRVPVGNRVGEEGQGWAIAKFLLGNERVSIADTGPKLRLLRHVGALHAAALASEDLPAALKPLLSAKFADVSIQLLTLCALERQYVDAWAAGTRPGADASVLKIRGTEILQALSELALELEGPLAAAHDPADLHRAPEASFTPAQRASLIGHEYLYGRCWSVFGGTNEIQRNIIARSLLG